MSEITIDKNLCSSCGSCVAICTADNFEQAGDATPTIKEEIRCNRCGHCIALCPKDAIHIQGVDMNRIKLITSGKISEDEMADFIASRRSIRHFKEKEVNKKTIEKLLESASMAATAKNGQDRSFVVIAGQDKVNHLEQVILKHIEKVAPGLKLLFSFLLFPPFASLFLKPQQKKLLQSLLGNIETFKNSKPDDHLIFNNAPAVVAAYAKKDRGMNRDVFGAIHCASALEYLMMQAHAMGLGTCWIGFAMLFPKVLNKELSVPKGYTVYGVVTLGYPHYSFKRTVARSPVLEVTYY